MEPNFDLRELVPLREAVTLLPKRRGKHLHISVLYRWRSRGIAGKRLWTTKLGAVLYTHPTALREFLSSLEPCLLATPAEHSPERIRKTVEVLSRVRRGRRQQ